MTVAETPDTWLDIRKRAEDLVREARGHFCALPEPTTAQQEAVFLAFIGLIIAQSGVVRMARALGSDYRCDLQDKVGTVLVHPDAMVGAANRAVNMLDQMLKVTAERSEPDGVVN